MIVPISLFGNKLGDKLDCMSTLEDWAGTLGDRMLHHTLTERVGVRSYKKVQAQVVGLGQRLA